MDPDTPIVKPQRGGRSPRLASRAVVAATPADMRRIGRLLKLESDTARRLYLSQVYAVETPRGGYTLAGPVMGAPYAVMLLETLVAWGARQIVFCGWCGSLSAQVAIGDLLVPIASYCDEGTSRHYHRDPSWASPAPGLRRDLIAAIENESMPYAEGRVWTTDAVFRETPRKVAAWHRKGAVAVEMETAALFTVGQHLKVEVAAMLIVSDALTTDQWQPGFKTAAFQNSRERVCTIAKDLCLNPPTLISKPPSPSCAKR